jgi:hypothetical protein
MPISRLLCLLGDKLAGAILVDVDAHDLVE